MLVPVREVRPLVRLAIFRPSQKGQPTTGGKCKEKGLSPARDDSDLVGYFRAPSGSGPGATLPLQKKRRLWSQAGQKLLRELPLKPWAARRRDDLLALPATIGKIEGAVLVDHLKSMDWAARKAEFHSKPIPPF